MKAEQYLKEVLEIENQSIIVDAMETWCRIQIEKDRERIKDEINFNDDGIKQAMEKLIDNTPITLD